MIRTALFVLSLTIALAAQTPILLNGQIWDGNGGPLASGGIYHIVSNGGSCGITVPTGQTLTIQPGAIVKIDGCFLVPGTLNAIGTQQSPIRFTSIHDDSIGGDTNNNGSATVPAPGDWGQNDWGGQTTCEWCEFYYGGANNSTAWNLRGRPQVFRDCRFEQILDDGFLGASEVTMERCHFEDLGGIPVQDLALRSIDRFVDNTAVNCAKGEYVRLVHFQGFAGNLVMDHRYSFNGSGVFVFNTTTSVTLPAGTSWMLPAGTVFKFERGRITSFGDIIAQGTQQDPVVMTVIEDDVYGGDTENDGNATQPAPGDWSGVEFQTADSSLIQHGVFRYGGTSSGQNVYISSSSAVLESCIVEHSAGDGVKFRALANSPARLTDCWMNGNGGLPVVDIHWIELSLCTGNVATNNGGGNHYRIEPERPSTPIEILPGNFPGDVLTLNNGTLINPGGSLRIPAGTILKFLSPSGSGFTVSSATASLYLDGTARRPVVLTSLKDDSHGGDTNGDGNATQPAPGDWNRIYVASSAGTVALENVLMRYSRDNSIDNGSPNLELRRVRIEHGAGTAFALNNAQEVSNCVAYDCADHGFELRNNTFDLVHATSANNGGNGIYRNGGWNGSVRNSNSWGNGTNVAGVPVAQMFSSNGDHAGANGNIDQDPLFVGAATGDLHLGTGSPCLGAADGAVAAVIARDHDEGSRISDHALSGGPAQPDMGAFEFSPYTMTATGLPNLGSTLSYTLLGPPGIGTFLIGFPSPPLLVQPLGVYLAGPPNVTLAGAPLLPGATATFDVPNNPGFVGVNLAVQGLGVQLTGALAGAFTQVDRIRIQL